MERGGEGEEMREGGEKRGRGEEGEGEGGRGGVISISSPLPPRFPSWCSTPR